MKTLFLIIALFSTTTSIFAQQKNKKSITDNNRKFYYDREEGITPSYIEHFGEQFQFPVFKTIDGKTISADSLKGKTVVFNFWFVACKPCVAEMPALNKLVQKHQSDSVVFIAFTFDPEVRVKEFLKQNQFLFQIASLPQVEVDKIKRISYYPFTSIINKEGKLSYALFGRPTGKDPVNEIFQLLDRKIEAALQ